MPTIFFEFRLLDIIDILFVAFLLYKLYHLTKSSTAFYIFIAIFGMFLLWMVIKPLNLTLTGGILQQIFSIGSIALVIIFQPEIRKFLTTLGISYNKVKGNNWLNKLFPSMHHNYNSSELKIDQIIKACQTMSRSMTGALIIIPRNTQLNQYAETGDLIDAVVSSRLLENIFFKNTPLHDGAVLILGNRVQAARCILPVSDNPNLPPNLGLRHRAALGLTEITDAVAVVVSEETGNISIAVNGEIKENLTSEQTFSMLQKLILNK